MQSYFQVVGMHWVIQLVDFVVGFYSNVVSVALIFWQAWDQAKYTCL